MMNKEEDHRVLSIYEDKEGIFYLEMKYIDIDRELSAEVERSGKAHIVTISEADEENEEKPPSPFILGPIKLGKLNIDEDYVTIGPYLPFNTTTTSGQVGPENKGKVIIKFEKA